MLCAGGYFAAAGRVQVKGMGMDVLYVFGTLGCLVVLVVTLLQLPHYLTDAPKAGSLRQLFRITLDHARVGLENLWELARLLAHIKNVKFFAKAFFCVMLMPVAVFEEACKVGSEYLRLGLFMLVWFGLMVAAPLWWTLTVAKDNEDRAQPFTAIASGKYDNVEYGLLVIGCTFLAVLTVTLGQIMHASPYRTQYSSLGTTEGTMRFTLPNILAVASIGLETVQLLSCIIWAFRPCWSVTTCVASPENGPVDLLAHAQRLIGMSTTDPWLFWLCFSLAAFLLVVHTAASLKHSKVQEKRTEIAANQPAALGPQTYAQAKGEQRKARRKVMGEAKKRKWQEEWAYSFFPIMIGKAFGHFAFLSIVMVLLQPLHCIHRPASFAGPEAALPAYYEYTIAPEASLFVGLPERNRTLCGRKCSEIPLEHCATTLQSLAAHPNPACADVPTVRNGRPRVAGGGRNCD